MLGHFFKGAAAGVIATVPMTYFMTRMHRELPKDEQYPLPPREITEDLLNKADMKKLSEPAKHSLTMVAHYSYGGVVGGLYPLILRNHLATAPLRNGICYGLGVWTASYLGLLPSLHILKPATEHPARRNALMIAAHIVWGGTLGLMVRSLTHQRFAVYS